MDGNGAGADTLRDRDQPLGLSRAGERHCAHCRINTSGSTSHRGGVPDKTCVPRRIGLVDVAHDLTRRPAGIDGANLKARATGEQKEAYDWKEPNLELRGHAARPPVAGDVLR